MREESDSQMVICDGVEDYLYERINDAYKMGMSVMEISRVIGRRADLVHDLLRRARRIKAIEKRGSRSAFSLDHMLAKEFRANSYSLPSGVPVGNSMSALPHGPFGFRMTRTTLISMLQHCVGIFPSVTASCTICRHRISLPFLPRTSTPRLQSTGTRSVVVIRPESSSILN